MVIVLTPYEQAPRFKHIRKMSMQEGYGSNIGGGKSTPLSHTYPGMKSARHSIYNSMRDDRGVMEEMQQPLEKRILSALTKDMLDILLDDKADDDVKANLYLNAINRYLTYSGKVNALAPVATMRRRRIKQTPEAQGVSAQHRYQNTMPNQQQRDEKQTRDLFTKLPAPFVEGVRLPGVNPLLRRSQSFTLTPSRLAINRGWGEEGGVGRGEVGVPPSPLPSLPRGPAPPAPAAAASDEMWTKPRDAKKGSDDSDDDDFNSIVSSDEGDDNDTKQFDAGASTSTALDRYPADSIVSQIVPKHKVRARRAMERIVGLIPAESLNWSKTGQAILNGTLIETPISALLQNSLNKKSKDMAGSTVFNDLMLQYRILNPSSVDPLQRVRNTDSEDDIVAPTGSGISNRKIVNWEV
jgi:hypothetical protein